MPIYDKPTWKLMHDMAGELLTRPGDITTKNEIHNWFKTKYSKIKRGTIEAHLNRMSTNVRARLHHTIHPGPDDLFLRLDPQRFRRYDRNTDPAPIYDESTSTVSEEAEVEELGSDAAEQTSSEFAFEQDLRNYLAKNLSAIEQGLRLYEDKEEGISGVEFSVGGRFIDILAVDSRGGFVVIELKVSRGYDRVVGQILRYIAWIRKNHADEAQNVRGVIVAREITEDLRLACSEARDIELFEYQLSMTLQRVQ